MLPCFDTASGVWFNLQTIPDPDHGYPGSRTCHTCVRYNDYAYICGGYFIPSGTQEENASLSKSFDDIWKFHLPTRKWSLVSTRLPKSLWAHAADVTDEGRMYVFGGCTKSQTKERINQMISIDLDTQKLEKLCWDVLTTSANVSIDSGALSKRYQDMLNA